MDFSQLLVSARSNDARRTAGAAVEEPGMEPEPAMWRSEAAMSGCRTRRIGALRGVRTWTWRGLATAAAALGLLLPAATAEAAKYWTIEPDVRPVLWIGLGPPATSGTLTAPTATLAVPTAKALDQHWSIRSSGFGYKIANRQSGQCLWGDPVKKNIINDLSLLRCSSTDSRRYSQRFNFHTVGRGAPVRVLSPGTYQLRLSLRRSGEEQFGRCLSVPAFQAGVRLVTAPCTRGTNQRFVLKSFTE